jgi:16S rRNA processing protein RimM
MNPPLVEIGYLSKLHGYKGSIKAELNTLLIEAGNFPEFVWINQLGKPVPYKVTKFAEQDKDTFVIKLEDINTEPEAHALKGETIYCEESIYDDFFEEEENLSYLIDYSLIDPKLGNLGKITDVMENTFQPNLVVDYNNTEVLVPLAEELIVKIDDKKKEITLNVPDGLLDIYSPT